MLELLKNALEATAKTPPSSGQGLPNIDIEISSLGDASFIDVEVRDYGVGIPKEHVDDVFRLGWSSSRKTSPLSGSGVGLSLAKVYAEMFHGSIRTRPVQQGKSFTVRLFLAGVVATF